MRHHDPQSFLLVLPLLHLFSENLTEELVETSQTQYLHSPGLTLTCVERMLGSLPRDGTNQNLHLLLHYSDHHFAGTARIELH
uniref:Secreted protein n=1 Tax=Arundo donax TaxID=35708 RepID=A0A0A9CZH0_ARUDO